MSNLAAGILEAEQRDHGLAQALVHIQHALADGGLRMPYRTKLTVTAADDSVFIMAMELADNTMRVFSPELVPSPYVSES